MRNITLLTNGVDDPYFLKIFESLETRGVQIGPVLSHFPLPGSSSLHGKDRVKIDHLYDANEVFDAMDGLLPVPVGPREFPARREAEWYFLSCIDRLCAQPRPVAEHKRHFRALVSFFFAFFRKYTSITHVVFTKTPHFAYDLVLFFVAESFGKTNIILQRTDIDDRLLLRSDWRYLRPFGSYRPAHYHEYSLKDLEEGSTWIAYSSRINQVTVRAMRKEQRRNWSILDFLRWMRLRLSLHRRPSIRWSDSSLFAAPPVTVSDIIRLRKIRRDKQTEQLRMYRSLATGTYSNDPYIFFALHFQPERSTMPEGQEFADQLLAIEILAACLPSGWKLLVKEHPRQFEPFPYDLRKLYGREARDYESMARIENVLLVPLDTNTDELANNARINSTVTGSTAWQALKKGIPAIVFGHPWYSNCRACRVVDSVESAKQAIEDLGSRETPWVREQVDIFLADLSPHLFPGTIGHPFAENSRQDYQFLVSSVQEALYDAMTGERPVL